MKTSPGRAAGDVRQDPAGQGPGEPHRWGHAIASAAAPRVLLVDDEPELCGVFADILSAAGYAVEVALDARTALARLGAQPFAVLVTDLRLPDTDGLALARAARRLDPDLMVVVITAHASMDTSLLAIRSGAHDYLVKPVRSEDLCAAVRQAVDRRRAREATRRDLHHLRRANAEMQSRQVQLHREIEHAGERLDMSAQQLARKVEQLELVNHIAATLTSELNLAELLDLSLQVIGRRLKALTASLMLYDERTGMLTVSAATGPDSERLIGHRQPLGVGVAGWVARRREPLLIPDIQQDPRFVPAWPSRHGDHRSCICVPLIARTELVGVLSVSGKADAQSLGDDERTVLVTVANQIAIAIQNAQLFQRQQLNSYQTVLALAESLEAKDPYTSGHSRRVTALALKLAEALSLSKRELGVLRYAGPLHDIGKIGIDQAILNKPSQLDHREWQIIRSHPVIGERIISHLDFLAAARPVIRHHHEHWDGSGYPDGLTGDGIPLLSRVLTVADTFDAITSARPYRPARAAGEGLQEVVAARGAQFDPAVCDAFLRALGGT